MKRLATTSLFALMAAALLAVGLPTASAATMSQELAVTGANGIVAMLVIAGVLLLAAVVFMVLAARRRRRHE